jgi:hypothetical protein
MRPSPGAEPMPAMAGGSPEADAEGPPAAQVPPPGASRPKGTRCLMILVPAWIAALATVVFGIVPSPLVDWAANAGTSLFG